MLKKISKIAIILVCGIILGTLLIIGAFALPVNRIENNVSKSLQVFNKEDVCQNVISGYKATQLDNFTDAIMLNAAMYNGNENLIDKAMNDYHESIDGKNPVDVMKAHFNGDKTLPSAYTRYWHGYLVVLKPLLLFFNYSDIRILNMFVQMFLVFLVIILMCKRNLKRYVIPFGVSIMFLCPVVLPLSMQYSTMFYILLLAMISILLHHEYFEEKSLYIYIFMIFGMVTSYFDFLTYPLVSLAMPLTLLLLIRNDKNLKNNVIEVIKLSIMWGIGYVFMWAGKWLVGSILLGQNVFKNAFDNVAIRTSLQALDYKITIAEVLRQNVNMLRKPIYILITAVIILWGIYKVIRIKANVKNLIITSIPYLIIICMPFVWYIGASNHSYIHSSFTFRELSICAFTGTCLIFKITEKAE